MLEVVNMLGVPDTLPEDPRRVNWVRVAGIPQDFLKVAVIQAALP